MAKGHVESRANRCNACCRVERERKAEARRVHLEGLTKKQSQQPLPNASIEHTSKPVKR